MVALGAWGVEWHDRKNFESSFIAHALWWLDAAMSVTCGIAIPYLMFTRQEHSVEKLTAVWLLPIVACEVGAAAPGCSRRICRCPMPCSSLCSAMCCGACSVPLAMSILVLLVLRLAVHKLPERDMGVSAWLALGPIGTGALGLLLLRRRARDLCGERSCQCR